MGNKDITDSEMKYYLKQKEEEKPVVVTGKKRLSTSHLAQLSLIVDTGGSYVGEDLFEFLKPPPKAKGKPGEPAGAGITPTK